MLVGQWFLNVGVRWNPSAGLLRHRLMGPNPRTSESFSPGWGLRTCISNEFPGVQVHGSGGHSLRTTALDHSMSIAPSTPIVFSYEVWYFNTRLYVHVLPFMLFCGNLNPACKFLWVEIKPRTLHALSFSVL